MTPQQLLRARPELSLGLWFVGLKPGADDRGYAPRDIAEKIVLTDRRATASNHEYIMSNKRGKIVLTPRTLRRSLFE